MNAPAAGQESGWTSINQSIQRQTESLQHTSPPPLPTALVAGWVPQVTGLGAMLGTSYLDSHCALRPCVGRGGLEGQNIRVGCVGRGGKRMIERWKIMLRFHISSTPDRIAYLFIAVEQHLPFLSLSLFHLGMDEIEDCLQLDTDLGNSSAVRVRG